MGAPRSTLSLPASLSCLKLHQLLRGSKIRPLTMANCFYTKFIAADYFEPRQRTELRGTTQVSGTLLCGKGKKMHLSPFLKCYNCICHHIVQVVTALVTIYKGRFVCGGGRSGAAHCLLFPCLPGRLEPHASPVFTRATCDSTDDLRYNILCTGCQFNF